MEKITNAPLLELISTGNGTQTKARKFDEDLLSKMKSIISKYTDRPDLLRNIEDLPEDTDINFIKELNIDSVDVVEIVVDVEEEFNITVTDDEIYSFQSFGDMYDLILAKLSGPDDQNQLA